MKELNYFPRLLAAGRPHDTNSNGIPIFAQPRYISNKFACEAVEWLYNNYRGFTLSTPADIPSFLTADVFNLDTWPCRSRLRYLNLNIDLLSHTIRHCCIIPHPISLTKQDLTPLADLAKVKLHHTFHVAVIFKATLPLPELRRRPETFRVPDHNKIHAVAKNL
jgi:hypothetical protein